MPPTAQPKRTAAVSTTKKQFDVANYDLASTLTSGQAFRWRRHGQSWVGVIGHHWVRLQAAPNAIEAELSEAATDWQPVIDYLQLHQDLEGILRTFPQDDAMQSAVGACHGLRLLKQDPWECLASFILSSTKQIVQIQQIIRLLCERFGERLEVPAGWDPLHTFPSPARLARVSEADLRACKMGFRARYLLAAAQRVHRGELVLPHIRALSLEQARAELLTLPGVGRKIADCVLLFAFGFPQAFPVDVWVARGLRELYFPRRQINLIRLQQFAPEHFGPNAGYAQQYLFHYMRTKIGDARRPSLRKPARAGRLVNAPP
jgi:N-glycosylase/DNA lyase